MNDFYYTFDGTLVYAERFERESEHVVLFDDLYGVDGEWAPLVGWEG